MVDVAVLGAGLAGLAAARDLHRAGADVVVLEARERPGGRVEAVALADGRTVQAGGEVFGREHTSYLELVDELGLTVEPSYVADPGEMSWGLNEGIYIGDEAPWMSPRERADAERLDREFAALAATVDPDDPWSHPQAARLDQLSLGAWLRERGALPAVVRRHELASLSLSCDGPERTSLLGELRKHATLAGEGFYDLERWEGLRVAQGSAEVALARWQRELGPRLRLGAVVTEIDIAFARRRRDARRRRARRRRGRDLRDPRRTAARGRDHRAERRAAGVAARPAPRAGGEGRRRLRRVVLAASRAERAGRDRVAVRLDVAAGRRRAVAAGAAGALLGVRRGAARGAPPDRCSTGSWRSTASAPASRDAMLERAWGADPYTLGYIASWAPGDLTRVGPLHGTHEPPFYVAGSDHWVAGYMEGAVKTGTGRGRRGARHSRPERALAWLAASVARLGRASRSRSALSDFG